jgi:hypothetical protein
MMRGIGRATGLSLGALPLFGGVPTGCHGSSGGRR